MYFALDEQMWLWKLYRINFPFFLPSILSLCGCVYACVSTECEFEKENRALDA